ncbi:MAG TPA: type II secretion system F family protein [Chitinivibrionales bacterium]|nr:type II secretion system F family protein [Chitinivibrionales bacterium]
MPRFEYIGVGANGKQTKGELLAGNKNEVITQLRKKKIRAISIKVKQVSLNPLAFLGSGVKSQEVSRFTRQLAAMTSAGLPLVQCLDILVGQIANKNFSQKVQQVSADIQVGSSLADALSKHSGVFNSLYCNMVAAGEASGNLDGVLNRIAEYLEKGDRLVRKIKSALTYPVIIIFIIFGLSAVMLTFVIPMFAQMFKDMGAVLPLPTRIVMGISDAITHNIVFIIPGIIIFIVSFTLYYRNPIGRYNIDFLLLRAPVIGELQRKTAVSRFSQTLATLLTSGVTILDAMSITAKTAGNKVLEKGLMRVFERISGGMTIADPLKDVGLFPPMVIQMIAVGEKTGDLSGMLTRISEFYTEEVDAAVESLTAIIEPIMIVIVGIVVGGMLIAMYLPIFSMIGNIE